MKITNGLLLKLLVLAAALAAMTWVISGLDGKVPAGFTPGAPLVQGFDAQQVGKIVVRDQGADGAHTATLSAQADGSFTIAEKDGYPADFEEINESLRTILDIRTAAKLANSPEANPEFGIAEKGSATADAAFFDKDGKEILKLYVGAANGRGHAVMTRGAAGASAVFRSETPVEISGQPLSFIDQTVLKADGKKIKTVEIERKDGKFSLAGKDGVLKLQNLPAGKEENDAEAWGLKDGLTHLMFEDVAKNAPAGLEEKCRWTVTMENGTVYRLALLRGAAGSWVTASSDEPRLARPENAVVLDHAIRYNRAHKGWHFKISDWNAERLDKPFAAFLKDIPQPEKKTEKNEPAPAENAKAGTAPAAPENK